MRNKKVDEIKIEVFNYINKTSKLIRMKESQNIISLGKTYCTLRSIT